MKGPSTAEIMAENGWWVSGRIYYFDGEVPGSILVLGYDLKKVANDIQYINPRSNSPTIIIRYYSKVVVTLFSGSGCAYKFVIQKYTG